MTDPQPAPEPPMVTEDDFPNDAEGWFPTITAGQVIVLSGDYPEAFSADEWTLVERMGIEVRFGGFGDVHAILEARDPSWGRPMPVAGPAADHSLVEEFTVLAFPGAVNDYAFTADEGTVVLVHQTCGETLGDAGGFARAAELADDHRNTCPIPPGKWQREYPDDPDDQKDQ